jgi:hypothetical protein
VDSANNGPYGEAIIKELIPAVEQKFRVIRQPWARMLSGGSTGGWIALAHQVLYPDFYGGSFALCPDSVDFSYHQIVNIYSDANAYYVEKGCFGDECCGHEKNRKNEGGRWSGPQPLGDERRFRRPTSEMLYDDGREKSRNENLVIPSL